MTTNHTPSKPKPKHTITRLALATATLLGAALAQAEPVTLRVHHFLPATSSAHTKLIQPWCDKIAQQSKDQLKCQIYPSMQLGGTPPQLYDQVKDGVVDVVWTIPTYAAGRFTKSEVFELPWMTTTAKGGSQALWTYVDQYAQDEFKGVHRIFMHVHDGALLHFKGKTPKTLEEMKGMKVRAATRSNAKMVEALGAVPIAMPLPMVPEALSKSVVDAAAVPWEGVPAIRLADLTKYHLDVPAGAPRISNTIFLFGMNEAKYQSLPPELKKVIDDNSGMAVSAWAGETGFDAVVEPFRKAAIDGGATVYTMPDAEYQKWVKATDSVDDGWVKDVSAKGADGQKLLAAAKALVKQYSK
ncbi:TRAP transporter substrate-binding protein [Hydrogenophaga sp. 5NK40-0174]|uniref:TRAP transporter substrate-binding protein n=1 Tax=Hydrogenophaga sp. 5NK40-0174 TaxID=3127649 RepID=UPI00310AF700